MIQEDLEILTLEHAHPIHEKIVVVSWFMGNCCNFSCPYCSSSLHDWSSKWPSFENAKKCIDKICDHYMNSGRTIYFDLTGGEVTLNKDLLKIIDYLNQKECWVGLITNGSRELEFWKEIKSKVDHISITFHPQFTKTEHFLSVVELLHKEVTTHVNIMMDPKFFDSCKWIGKELASRTKNISLSYQPLVKELGFDHNMIDYSLEQIFEIVELENINDLIWTRKMKSCRGRMNVKYENGIDNVMSTPELLATGKNNWSGWHCWAGLEQLVIDENGRIFRAWCRQDLIGNINDDTITFPQTPTICRTENCSCQLDLASSKSKELHLKKSLSLDENKLLKIKIPLYEMSWFSYSDNSDGGNSLAEIQSISATSVRALLIARVSELDSFYAFFGFSWTAGDIFNSIGLEIKMFLDRGKILAVQFPLSTNLDHDFYQTEILGEGENCYKIYFRDVRQGAFGKKIEWNLDFLKEIRFLNEFIKNDSHITIKEINLLTPPIY